MKIDDIDFKKTGLATGIKQEIPQMNIDDITPLVTLESLQCEDKKLIKENKKIFDGWKNQIASIGANNSLQQFSEYSFNRMSYQECASLATDAIIHKAIETITQEVFNHGGSFTLLDDEQNKNFDIVEFNKEFKNNGFFNVARKAFYNSLVYGGGFVFINTTDTDEQKQLYFDKSNKKKFVNFKNIEAWQFAPATVNTYNPLKDDYMAPTEWYVMNAGTIHTSRFIKIITFPISDLYKPMFNYLGLPLSFFMKNYVAVADTIRQSLGDLFLRFSSVVVKVPNHKVSNQEGYDRVKHIIATRNNLGGVVLAQDEEYIVDNFSLTGLYDIVQHAYELVTATSYVPTVKLLGIEPSGFNSTGEFSMKNFQDNISAFQKNVVTPLLVQMAESYLSLNLGEQIKFDFEWNALGQPTEEEAMNINNAKADYLIKLKDNDVLTPKDVLQIIKDNDLKLSQINAEDLPDNYDFDLFEAEEEEKAKGLSNE